MTTHASPAAPPPLPVPVSARVYTALLFPPLARAARGPRRPLSSRLALLGALNRDAQQPFCSASYPGSSAPAPPQPPCRPALARSPAYTCSAVMGNAVSRTPTASKTALATAAGTATLLSATTALPASGAVLAW